MEIKKECEYEFEELIKGLASIPMNKDSKKMALCSFILLLLGIVFTVISFIDNELENMLLICGIIVIISAVFLLTISMFDIPFVRSKLFYNKLKENNKQLKNGIKYEYTFYDSSFDIKSSSETINGTMTVNYNEVSRFTYDANNIYIFINRVNTYLCKKSLFTEDELKEIIYRMPKKCLK